MQGSTVQDGQVHAEKLTRMDFVRFPSLPAQEGVTITIDNPLHSYEAADYWAKVAYKASIGTNSLVAKYKLETGGATSDNNQGAEGGFKNIKHNTNSRAAAMEELAVYMNEVHDRFRDQELAMSTAARFLDDHMSASRAIRRANAQPVSASARPASVSVSDRDPSARDPSARPAKKSRSANDATTNDANANANANELGSEEEIIESQWCRRNKSFDQIISEIKMHSQGMPGGAKGVHIRLLIYVAERCKFEHPTYSECKDNARMYRGLIQLMHKYVPGSSTFTVMYSGKYTSKPSSAFVKWMREYRDHLEALSDHNKVVAAAEANSERNADVLAGNGTDSQPTNETFNQGLSALATETMRMETGAEDDEAMHEDGPVGI